MKDASSGGQDSHPPPGMGPHHGELCPAGTPGADWGPGKGLPGEGRGPIAPAWAGQGCPVQKGGSQAAEGRAPAPAVVTHRLEEPSPLARSAHGQRALDPGLWAPHPSARPALHDLSMVPHAPSPCPVCRHLSLGPLLHPIPPACALRVSPRDHHQPCGRLVRHPYPRGTGETYLLTGCFLPSDLKCPSEAKRGPPGLLGTVWDFPGPPGHSKP